MGKKQSICHSIIGLHSLNLRTVERRWAVVLAPANAAGGVEILVDKMAALLEMVDALDAVAPPDLLAEDLGLLDMYPLLPNQVLPHLQHRHWVLVRVLWIEVVRSSIVEHNSLLPHHLSLSLSLS